MRRRNEVATFLRAAATAAWVGYADPLARGLPSGAYRRSLPFGNEVSGMCGGQLDDQVAVPPDEGEELVPAAQAVAAEHGCAADPGERYELDRDRVENLLRRCASPAAFC